MTVKSRITPDVIDAAQGAELRLLYKTLLGKEAPKTKVETIRAQMKAALAADKKDEGGKAGVERVKEAAERVKAKGGKKEAPAAAAEAPAAAEAHAAAAEAPAAAAEAPGKGKGKSGERAAAAERTKDAKAEAAAAAKADKARRAAEKAAEKASAAQAKADKAAGKAKAGDKGGKSKADGDKGGKDKDGVGALCRELIMGGKHRVPEILEAVMERFPDANTTAKDVYWYRWDLKRNDAKVPPWPAKPAAAKPAAEAKGKK